VSVPAGERTAVATDDHGRRPKAAMRVRDEFGGNEEARGDAYLVRRRRGERSVPLI